MKLLPYLFHRLCSARGLVFVCSVIMTQVFPLQAAELEGRIVPLDSSAPAVLSMPEQAKPVIDVQELPASPQAVSTSESVSTNQSAPSSQSAPSPLVAPTHDYATMYHDEQAIQAFEQRIERMIDRHSRGNSIDLSQFVPITAIVFSLGGPIFLLCFLINRRYRYRQLQQQSLNENIDKFLAAGRDIPPEFLRNEERKAPGDLGNRDKGIRNICIGTGVLIFLSILTGISTGSIGFIWIALGVSQVLIWHLNQPKAGQPQIQQVEQQD